MLTDIDGSHVVEVAPRRTESAAELVHRSFTNQQRWGVRAIAAAMLPAYATAAAKHLPNAELVHDRFHVAKHLGEDVDKVQRDENKALMAIDDDRLKGTRQLWLFSKKNLSAKHARRLKSPLAAPVPSTTTEPESTSSAAGSISSHQRDATEIGEEPLNR